MDDDDPNRNKLRFNEKSFVSAKDYYLPDHICIDESEFFAGLYDNSFNNHNDMVLDFNVIAGEY